MSFQNKNAKSEFLFIILKQTIPWDFYFSIKIEHKIGPITSLCLFFRLNDT